MPKLADDNIIEAGQGHNSLSHVELRNYCERIEALAAQKKELSDEIASVLEEADINGFHKKTIREVIKIRAMDPDKRREQDDLRDAYLVALGLL